MRSARWSIPNDLYSAWASSRSAPACCVAEGDEGRASVLQRLGYEREGTARPVRVDGLVEVARSL